MRTRILGAALVAAVALVCPQVAQARIVTIGNGASVTVATTATVLDDTGVPDTLDRYVTICNPIGNAEIRIGGSGVTTTTGSILRGGQCWGSGERLDAGVKVYAIATGGASISGVTVQESR